MSLTRKKRRLEAGVAASPGSGDADASDESSWDMDLGGPADNGGAATENGGGAAAPASDSDADEEETRAFKTRRREIAAGKRKAWEVEAAKQAAKECARRAAGGHRYIADSVAQLTVTTSLPILTGESRSSLSLLLSRLDNGCNWPPKCVVSFANSSFERCG